MGMVTLVGHQWSLREGWSPMVPQRGSPMVPQRWVVTNGPLERGGHQWSPQRGTPMVPQRGTPMVSETYTGALTNALVVCFVCSSTKSINFNRAISVNQGIFIKSCAQLKVLATITGSTTTALNGVTLLFLDIMNQPNMDIMQPSFAAYSSPDSDSETERQKKRNSCDVVWEVSIFGRRYYFGE